VVTPVSPGPGRHTPPGVPHTKRADIHLRSTQAVTGYHVKTTDGLTGHVSDFMMDDQTWAIHELVVKTGHRLTGKDVQIPVSKVIRISYEDSSVIVNLTSAAVELSPAHHLTPVGAA
jgi:sporulation protein YlmC with PRC-barrel domain